MKTLKNVLMEEAPSKPKVATAVDVTRQRQDREKQQMKIRQSRELAKAREQDFRKKEMERRSQEQQKMAKQRTESIEIDFGPNLENVYEYLEDGTLELVNAYKKMTPGEN